MQLFPAPLDMGADAKRRFSPFPYKPAGRLQGTDKAHNRGNCPDKREIGGNFCYLRPLHLRSAATYAHVSPIRCKLFS